MEMNSFLLGHVFTKYKFLVKFAHLPELEPKVHIHTSKGKQFFTLITCIREIIHCNWIGLIWIKHKWRNESNPDVDDFESFWNTFICKDPNWDVFNLTSHFVRLTDEISPIQPKRFTSRLEFLSWERAKSVLTAQAQCYPVYTTLMNRKRARGRVQTHLVPFQIRLVSLFSLKY